MAVPVYKSRDFPSASSTGFVVKLLNFCQSDKRKFFLKVVSVCISIWVMLNIFYYTQDLCEHSGHIPCLFFYWVFIGSFFVCFKINCLFCNTFRLTEKLQRFTVFFFLMPSLALLIMLDGLNKYRSPGILGLVIGMSSHRRTQLQLMTLSCLWGCSSDRFGRFLWASD